MLKRLAAWAISFVLLLAGQSLLQTRAATLRIVTLEATLLAFGPHLLAKCGQDYVHQVARYRVEKVLSGAYSGKEIVVDHPACDGNVFKRIRVGSRVKLTVRVLDEYNVITMHPGVREGEHPKIFYVASAPPKKL